jgi:UrcA family protein
MRTLIISAAAALAVVATTPAIAGTGEVEVRVSYGDLGIDSAEGRAALEARIERAVRNACEVRDPLGRNAAKTDWDCVAGAKSAALAQIDRGNEDQVAMAAE